MMTRRDWWLGIAVLVVALAIHAVITIMAWASVRSDLEAMFKPGVRPLASVSQPFSPDSK